jgi:preprotein translocase subunit SecA
MLKRAGVIHTVLNAKFHQQEAEIVTRAGQRGAVTIATNMAGRGTDIKLGEGVRELGGLLRHRHRAPRVPPHRPPVARPLLPPGRPGLTKFFLSLEDDLMRLFLQGNLASKIMEGSMKEGEELEHKWLNYSIESGAEEGRAAELLASASACSSTTTCSTSSARSSTASATARCTATARRTSSSSMIEEEVASRLESAGFDEKGGAESACIESLVGWLNAHFPISAKLDEFWPAATSTPCSRSSSSRIKKAYALKESVEDQAALGGLERYIVINAIDHHWQEHLTEMEELRRSIGLRSYGQKDPLSEYKSEAFRFFEELMNNVRLQICTSLFRSATNRDAFENLFAILSRSARLQGPAAAPTALGAAAQASAPEGEAPAAAPAEEIKLPSVTIRREAPKVGRNDPCPCGSGKKFKNCHGVG